MAEEKTLKVAVFGASGGIGKRTIDHLNLYASQKGIKINVVAVARPESLGKVPSEPSPIEFSTQFLDSEDEKLIAENAYGVGKLQPEFKNSITITKCNLENAEELREKLAGTQFAFVTAGLPRKGAQERAELILDNDPVAEQIHNILMDCCPEAVKMFTTNPIGYLMSLRGRASNDPNLLGVGGEVDEPRFKIAAANELSKIEGKNGKLEVAASDISIEIEGDHGPEKMLIDFSKFKIKGLSLDEYLAQEGADLPANFKEEVSKQTLQGGTIRKNNEGKTSTRGPAAAMVLGMMDKIINGKPVAAISYDNKTMVATGAHLTPQYANEKVVGFLPNERSPEIAQKVAVEVNGFIETALNEYDQIKAFKDYLKNCGAEVGGKKDKVLLTFGNPAKAEQEVEMVQSLIGDVFNVIQNGRSIEISPRSPEQTKFKVIMAKLIEPKLPQVA